VYDGVGVRGVATGSGWLTNYGVWGQSDTNLGIGVMAVATFGGYALPEGTYRIWAQNNAIGGAAVMGYTTNATGPNSGVRGECEGAGGTGVLGWAKAQSGTNRGVHGVASSGYAGSFDGNVHLTGTLTGPAGPFLIDHPARSGTMTQGCGWPAKGRRRGWVLQRRLAQRRHQRDRHQRTGQLLDLVIVGSRLYVCGIDAFIGGGPQANFAAFFRLRQPDGLIKTNSTGFAGNGVYNGSGADQTRSLRVRRGATGEFTIRITNDGFHGDGFTLEGPGSGGGFTARYFAGSTNITSQVVAGTYQVPSIAPGQSRTIELRVTVGNGVADDARRSWQVQARSTGAGSPKDVVKATVIASAS
jgi:hypothetical protein